MSICRSSPDRSGRGSGAAEWRPRHGRPGRGSGLDGGRLGPWGRASRVGRGDRGHDRPGQTNSNPPFETDPEGCNPSEHAETGRVRCGNPGGVRGTRQHRASLWSHREPPASSATGEPGVRLRRFGRVRPGMRGVVQVRAGPGRFKFGPTPPERPAPHLRVVVLALMAVRLLRGSHSSTLAR
jgi:hypothetical protein